MSKTVRTILVLLIGFALAASYIVASPWMSTASAEEAAPEPEGTPEPVNEDLDPLVPSVSAGPAADFAAALAAAEASGEPVEDLSARTETDTTWVNADGTFTVEYAASPIRVADESAESGWRDVDLSLVDAGNGTLAAAASTVPVFLSGNGSGALATVGFANDSTLALSVPDGVLGAPSVSGGVAVYPLSDSIDVQVSTTASGVNVRYLLTKEPSVEELAALRLDLTATGASVREADHGLEIVDGDGVVIGATSSFTAWDSDFDDAGDPSALLPVTGTLTTAAALGGAPVQTLQLEVPEGLISEDTTYPVTVDPDISTLTMMRDTYVYQGSSTVFAGSSALRVGSADGVNTTYSYLKFFIEPIGNTGGTVVNSATLKLRQYYAPTCGNTTMNVHLLGSEFGAYTVWADRPTALGQYAVSKSFNHGASGCAAAWEEIPITTMVNSWAAGQFENHGIRLAPPSDQTSNTAYDKRFCSMDWSSASATCNTASYVPRLAVNYNKYPDIPTNLTVTPATDNYTSKLKPTFRSYVADADGHDVRAHYEVHSTNVGIGSSTLLATCSSDPVASGHTAPCTLTTALPDNSRLYVRARSTDTSGLSRGWGGLTTFWTAATNPAQPTISCPSPYTDGSWQNTEPSSNVTCTISFSGTGNSKPVSVQYSRDSGSTQSSTSASTNATISNDPGQHTIRARTKSASGLYSSWVDYQFGYGPRDLSIGALPDDSFHEFSLSDDTVARVNIGSGNLLVSVRDMAVTYKATTIPVDRYWNGLSVNQWVIGDENVSLSGTSTANGDKTFHGPNGFEATFTKDGSVWKNPAGFAADLTEGSSTYRVTYRKSAETFQFNSSGVLLEHKDRNGRNLEPEESPALDFTATGGNVTSVSNAFSQQVDYTHTTDLDSVDYADGSEASYSYDSAGRLTGVTVPGPGNAPVTTTFAYDTNNRVSTVTQPSTSTTWGAAANIVTEFDYTTDETTITDPRGGESVFEIDLLDRVTASTDQLDRKRTQTWTANGDVASTTDAFASESTPGNETTYEYDERSNMKATTLPTGATAQAQYGTGVNCSGTGPAGTADQPTCSTDAQGNTTSNEYDSVGNLTKTSDTSNNPAGVAQQTYVRETDGDDCDGEIGQVCSSTDGNGNATDYQYDGEGNVATVTPPAPLGETTSTYDILNRLISSTDGNGDTTEYEYDAADRITQTTYENGDTLSTVWNHNGTKASETDTGAGLVTSYEYDAQGLQTRKTMTPIGGGAATLNITYRYDASGNLTGFTDSIGTTSYTYDASNAVKSVQEPGGTCPTSGLPSANSRCTVFTYDEDGREQARIFPGGARQTTTYDDSSRPSRIIAKDAAEDTVVDIAYSYTLDGQDTGIIQSRTAHKEQGIDEGAATVYTYDTLNRISSAVERDTNNDETARWEYEYDLAGNRTRNGWSGDAQDTAGNITYTYNGANQITSTNIDNTTWTYDDAGNQTRNGITGHTTQYGDRLQAIQIGGVTQDYFGQGNTERVSSGSSTSYQTSALGLASTTQSGAATTFTRTGEGDLTGFRSTASNYYVFDHLGSVVGIFSGSGTFLGGYSYSPYGEERHTASNTTVQANLQRYIGGQNDGNGLYKLGARYYDPSLGRFTQMDPSGQERLPYAYAKCNPVNTKDPTGLSAPDGLVCAGPALITGAIWGAGFSFGGPPGAVVGVLGGLIIGIVGTVQCL